jgi:hypothetical protein
MRGQRGTGHYGTGTYFLSKPTNEESYANRPEHRIDFSKYKLFKPKDYQQGYDLHEGLKTINNYRYKEDRLQESLNTLSNIFGIDPNQLQELYKNQVLSKEVDLTDDKIMDRSIDTLSTVLMKALGYQGIDVRHLQELDNFGYGSVIYDLLEDSVIK